MPNSERRLAAILAADAVGFTTRMLQDEAAALRAVRASLDALELILGLHSGRVVKTLGDGLLAEFSSVVNAVSAAASMQEALAQRRRDLSPAACFDFRIGVHVGDVVSVGNDILGEGVNLAARLEAAADPGGLLISERVHVDVKGKVDLVFEDRGRRQLKGIPDPVRVFSLVQTSKPRIVPDAPSLPDRPSVAVLPFLNMSSDPEQEYFADGLTEDLITALASVPWLFVIARNSSFAFKGGAVDVRQVGHELGVRYVLEGSVRRAGDRLRITGQLIDAESVVHLWADRIDGPVKDVFELQDRVTDAVVMAISPHIQGAEIARASVKRPDSQTAYDRMLRAMAALNRANVAEAMEQLDEALALAPRYGKALALEAWCLTLRSAWAVSGDFESNKSRGLDLVSRALEAASDDPEVEAYSGYTLGFFGEDLERAFRLLRGAAQRCPSFLWAWTSVAMLEGLHGDPQLAFEACDRAQRLNPKDPMAFRTHSARACAYQAIRDWTGLLREAQATASLMPNVAWIQSMIIVSLGELGRESEAREASIRLMHRFPDFSVSRMLEVFGRMRNMQGENSVIFERRLRTAGLPN